MRKLNDIVIYRDDRFYAAFPSVVSRRDGELLVAFRRAPDRRRYSAPGVSHCDPNSYLVLVRSRDLGRTWSGSAGDLRGNGGAPAAVGVLGVNGVAGPGEPDLIYAHPFGGSQDPCMVELDDGTLLVTSYAWMALPPEGQGKGFQDMEHPAWGMKFTFLGGYLVRSQDGGRTWQGPILPPQMTDAAELYPGIAQPSMNRGALTQGHDGVLYWAVCRAPKGNPNQAVLDLLVSRDRGLTWERSSVIAADEKVVFNETSLIETPRGDLVAFVRTAHFNDHGVAVRSRDKGKTWQPWSDTGVLGHPYHATRLPDGRVFLIYGYRHEPYGIRARVLDPECTDFTGGAGGELVLRDDGGNSDLGYPWACVTADGRVLGVYYINHADGTRYIGGTFVEI